MEKIYYFDNAATTFPKPNEVYEFMDKFYRENGVNVGRGQYSLVAKANFLVNETRDLILNFFNCSNKKVIFTSGATEAINICLQGIDFKERKNIYLSPFEHNSITRTINFLSKKYDINVYLLEVDKKTLTYDMEEIEKQFILNNPDTVIISHVSNVCGLIAPVEEIFTLSKKYNSLNIVDTCQSAGITDINLGSDIFDIGIFAGHKTLYGPLGTGGLIIKNSLKITPLLYGGTGLNSASQELPEEIPEKYETGSQNILSISGLNRSLKWIKEISIGSFRKKEEENKCRLLEILKKYPNIEIIGFKDNEKNSGVISCNFKNYSADEMGKILNRFNIAVRTGLHCSPSAHKFLGTFPGGTVRFSTGYFNTEKDFEHLEEVLTYIKENS